MTVSTCPIATIETSLDQVWQLLADTASYALWWDAQTCSIAPPGLAHPGQKIYAQSSAFGKRWEVHIIVNSVDATKHQIDLTTELPLGITVHNHIACSALNPTQCRVAFG